MSISSRKVAVLGLLLGFVCVSVPATANDADRLLRALTGGLFNVPPQQDGRGRVPPSQQANPGRLDAKEMYTAQTRLRELGYDVGQPDGQAGPRTREAIRQFQQDNGFRPDGMLTISQFHHMMQNDGPAADRPPSDTADIPLSPGEMADMQRGLAKLGFDVGEADGKGGSRTGRALSKFLTDRGYDPYQTSEQTAYQLVTEAAEGPAGGDGGNAADPSMAEGTGPETGEAASGQELAEAEVTGEYIDWPSGSTNYDGDRLALHRELTRRIVGSAPEILDNPNTMARWLEEMGRGYRGTWSPPEIAGAYKSYSGGSEFDKKAALSDFQAFMATQGLTTPLRITRVRPAEFGAYDFKSGSFPLRNGDDFGAEMSFYASGGNRIIAEAPGFVLPASLPMPRDKAEALAAKFNAAGSRLVYMTARMKIGNFRLEDDRFGQKSIFAQTIVEKVYFHQRPKNGETGFGTVIAEIEIKPPEVEAPERRGPSARNNLESWTRLGFASQQRRVVLPIGNEYESGGTDRKPGREQMAFGLLQVANLPAQPKSVGTVRSYASTFASSEAYRSLFPAVRDEQQFLRDLEQDPFRQDELVKRFNADVLPRIVAEAPRLPVQMRVSMPVGLGGYDIPRQAFGVEARRLFLPGVQLDSNLRGESPRTLRIGPQIARGLVERAKRNKGQLVLYYGVDLDLDKVSVRMREDRSGVFERADTHTTVTGAVTAVSLYEDRELTRLILKLPLEDFVPPAEILPGSQAPDGPYLSQWNVSALAAEMTGDPELSRKLVETSQIVTSKNEFERDDAIRRGLNTLDAARPNTAQPLYLMGEIGLGTYDGREAFHIAKWSFAVLMDQNRYDLDSGLVAIAPENSDALARFPIDRAAAEKLVKDYPGRTFPARFRVRPLRAERLAGQNKPFARVDVAVEQIMLMDQKRTDRVIFAIRTEAPPTVENGSDIVLEQVPERLPLNTETAALLLAKYRKTAPDEAALRVLLARRWEEESRQRWDVINRDPAPWGRFFPKNYRQLTEADYARLLPRFRRWTELRIAALPEKLLYENFDDQSGFEKYFGWPAEQYADAFRQFGIDRRAFAGYRGHLFNEQVDGPGGSMTPKTVLSLVPELKPRIRADVYVPLENLPAPPRDAFARAISLDLDIRGAVVGNSPVDGRPMVVLDAVPTEVRWFGERTATTPRSMIAKFPVPPIEPRVPVAEQALDLMGVRIGMTQEEAEKTIREQLKVERILELKGDPTNLAAVAESARLYVGAGGVDMVGILYGPMSLEPKVYGVARSLFSPFGSVTKGQVLAALSRKYGEPADPNQWRWGESIDLSGCGEPGSPGNLNWSGATVIEGKPLLSYQVTQQQLVSDTTLAAEIRLIRRIQNLSWGFDVRSAVERCTPAFVARFQESYGLGYAGERIPDGNTTVLWSWLFDHTQHYRALVEAQNAPKPAAEAIDLKL